MRFRNTVAVLGLLPLNALVVGYGWLAVGMTGWAASFGPEPYRPPVAELGVACGGVVLIGVALWSAGLRRAATFQVVPLAALVLFMTG